MKKIKKRLVHHRNLLSRGHTEISLFYSTIQMSILVWLFLRDIISFSRVWIFIVAPGCALAAIIIQYMIGYLMDKYRVIHDLQAWDFERNPLITGIIESLSNRRRQNVEAQGDDIREHQWRNMAEALGWQGTEEEFDEYLTKKRLSYY